MGILNYSEGRVQWKDPKKENEGKAKLASKQSKCKGKNPKKGIAKDRNTHSTWGILHGQLVKSKQGSCTTLKVRFNEKMERKEEDEASKPGKWVWRKGAHGEDKEWSKVDVK